MDIVINASPLILLSKTGNLSFLNTLFKNVYIPMAVLEEINEIGKSRVCLEQIEFQSLEIGNKLAVLGLLGRLHLGEVEVMVGAIEQKIQTVVLDDNAARNKAKHLGLNVTGTLGILQGAYKKGLVDDLEHELMKLKREGMFLSDEIVKKILASA
jgi:predicted nucleic acid-binding protein